ncbi:MAG: protein-L-isoaspartate(D-aspartate) O-methyltransferase [Chloroflexia bacterium]|nr:protein-L-isoaspartate(D-aspartate) O-methyltransferase [Chloroflexia bacterium]
MYVLSNFKLTILIIILMSFPFCVLEGQDYKSQRERMVENQIRARGVSDQRVLVAMEKVERHLFVPKGYQYKSYDDSPLPIGEGQTISQPYIVAYMTEILKLDGTEKVLEVGTGSGYQAAILAELAKEVYTIEVIKILGERAQKLLEDLNYKNLKVRVGDGYQGWKEHAPFDAIIVTCAPTHVPEALKEQLAEGGIMVIPVGQKYAQELVVLTKKKDKLVKKETIGVRFVPMIDDKGSKY